MYTVYTYYIIYISLIINNEYKITLFYNNLYFLVNKELVSDSESKDYSDLDPDFTVHIGNKFQKSVRKKQKIYLYIRYYYLLKIDIKLF